MNQALNKKDNIKPSSSAKFIQSDSSGEQPNRLLSLIVQRYRIFIASACLLLMAGSFIFFFVPQYQMAIDEAQANNELAEIELINKQRYQSNLVRLSEFYKKIDQSTRDKIVDILPIQLNKENLLAEIEAICQMNSLLIKSSDITGDSGANDIKPVAQEEVVADDSDLGLDTDGDFAGIATPDGQLRSAIIKLELTGQNYNSFKGLLKTIENNIHLMDIENLSYIPGKNQIILEIKIYYLAS